MEIKFTTLFIVLTGIGITGYTQEVSQEYTKKISLADSLFAVNDFKNAASAYSLAFSENGGIGVVKHRYKAARSWALDGNADSAFYQLYRIAKKAKYFDYDQINGENDFRILRTNKQWEPLMTIILKNKRDIEAALNKSIPSINRF